MHRFIIIDMIDIEKFISRVRDSFIGSQQVYTEGSCYHFYLILKEVFPDAECIYDGEHVLTRLDGKCYDITGLVSEPNGASDFGKPATYWLKSPYNIYKPIQ